MLLLKVDQKAKLDWDIKNAHKYATAYLFYNIKQHWILWLEKTNL